MTSDMDSDLIAIKEWLLKETYLPNDINDIVLKKFLHSCYGSLEKTKKCIEKFCSGRCNIPELYTSRDPCSVELETAFSLSYVATFAAGENEILMQYLEAPTLEKYVYYDVFKAISIQGDHWLETQDVLPEGVIVILDMKYITLKLIPKESLPVRLKQVHLINCPTYVEKLFALVKGVLPQDIIDLISFHATHEGLYSTIDKKYLPVEYGGDAPSFKQQHRDWVESIKNNKQMFLDDNLWKADLSKKRKPNNGDVTSVNGSFRTLAID